MQETPETMVVASNGHQEDSVPKGTNGNGAKTRYTREEQEYFRPIILAKRNAAIEDVARMRHLLDDSRDAGNDTAYSFHMADAGTDAMGREKLYLMIARQNRYIGYLDRAEDRINNGTYGICKVTCKLISRERLEAVPHTEISIDAKRAQPEKKNVPPAKSRKNMPVHRF